MSRKKRQGLPEKTIEDPVSFLVDAGIIWHWNRTVMHPVGLHIVVDVDPATGELAITKIVDRRERPDQVFSKEEWASGNRRWTAFYNVSQAVMGLRKKLLGFVTQEGPPGEQPAKKEE